MLAHVGKSDIMTDKGKLELWRYQMKDIQMIDKETVFNYRVSGAVNKNNKIMLN